MKKIAVLSIVFFSVIFLSGCGQGQSVQIQPEEFQQVIPDQPEEEQQAVQAQPNMQQPQTVQSQPIQPSAKQQVVQPQPVKKQSAVVRFFKKIYYSVQTTVTTISRQAESAMSQLVDEKVESINTPAPPIGSLTPVRDLKGTWKNSLAGRGLQLYGSLAMGGGATSKIYQNGDIELIIESVENNVALGKMRFINSCATVTVSAPKIEPITTKQCSPNGGYFPAKIIISGTRLDFGSGVANGISYSAQGNYTTDIMYGTMTITLPSYGALKGEFNLTRVRE